MSTDGPQPTPTAPVHSGALHEGGAVPPVGAPGRREPLGSSLRQGATKAARFLAVRRVPIASAAVGLAVLTALWTALILRDLRAATAGEIAAAQRSLENVTEVGVHAMQLAIRGADLLLIDLRDEWEHHRWHFAGLVTTRQAHPAIGFGFDVTVLDRHGAVTFSTLPDRGTGLGQRPLFPRLRDSATDVLSISAVHRSGDRLVMDLARRLTAPGGAFDGVVICSVPSDYLRAQFADVDLEPRTTLTAVRRDGRVLVRLTSGAGGALADSSPASRSTWSIPAYGASRRESFSQVSSTADGSQQLVAWRDAHEYPFTFVVARPTDSLDAALTRLRWRYHAIGTVLSVGLLAGLWRFVRHQELRERTAREQARQLRALTQAQEALAASEDELRKSSAHHLAVKEAEHRRVAREIHDELGQRLTVHRIDLAMLPDAVREDPRRDLPHRVAAMKSDVDAMLAIARDIAGKLRPGALDIGLAPAVESMLNALNGKVGVRCELDNRLPPDFSTDNTRATTAFRIVQEAVTNAVRHSNAGSIRVVLDRSPEHLLLHIEDDGTGFKPRAQARGFGVKGMRERAQALGGVLRIASTAGQGTTVQADLPLKGDIEPGTQIPAPHAVLTGT